MIGNCRVCCGVSWVCESHSSKAFDYELGCACSEGMPCECNDSTPPDTSQVIIIIEEVTVH
ncbi:hypothetical protein GGQ85_004308 [Nitrobacter vulgaris]|jgi:hypothetical protein|nr:hypothetical protein [Nitrobacter vulgaris]